MNEKFDQKDYQILSKLIELLASAFPANLFMPAVLIFILYFGMEAAVDKGEVDLYDYFKSSPTRLLELENSGLVVRPLEDLGDENILNLIDALFVAISNGENEQIDSNELFNFIELVTTAYGDTSSLTRAYVITQESANNPAQTRNLLSYENMTREELRTELESKSFESITIGINYPCEGGFDSQGFPTSIGYQLEFVLDPQTGKYDIAFNGINSSYRSYPENGRITLEAQPGAYPMENICEG